LQGRLGSILLACTLIDGAMTEHVEKDLEIRFINPSMTPGGVWLWI
jgi:hypothetical protein